MGTNWSAKAYLPEGVSEAEIDRSLKAVFNSYIKVFSLWEPEAFISRFNAAEVGVCLEVPKLFQRVWHAGVEVTQHSHGAFNPFCFSEISNRGYNPIKGVQLSGIAKHPANVFPIGHSVITKELVPQIDLNAIAKGAAVDAMAHELRELGCVSFLVEIGGEFFGQGLKADNQPWWVDVENTSSLDAIHRVALLGVSVATSGNIHKQRLNSSAENGHILLHEQDEAAFTSVTVIHPVCMYADAWATALFAAPETAMEIANTQNLAVIFEFSTHKISYSKMLKNHFIE